MDANILSFSGGKDSTAMLHLMLDRGEPIRAVIYCDMGDWEFPEMADHIAQVERNTGITVTRVYPKHDLTKRAFDHRYIYKDREYVGYGWPNVFRRWCTSLKQSAIEAERRRIGSGPHCIGLAVDETRRPRRSDKRYPLDEYGYTEADCLAYCKSLGYSWGGLYDIYDRVSCWCCPLQSLRDLYKLWRYRPELWARLREMDKLSPPDKLPFAGRGIDALEVRFAKQYRQFRLFCA